MGKRTGENQDYYKRAGQATGRRILAKERSKLAQEKAAEKAVGAQAPAHEPPVKAIPGAKQTLDYARRAREGAERARGEKAARRATHDEVQRMVEAEVPGVAPPERQLPKASVNTELSDLWRSVEENARSVGQSVRAAREAGLTFYRSLAELLRTPIRFLRLVREAGS